ncbi:hypothetical protein COV18_05365 [Candidatus Woesearchaeota archaeon CG10_big_fil_rev_8_21_14_0_10_37_12]|nr:MAG: hypothetical protein COV18_05365 [Candidatus Woesearchaeota archaeon CG10_big_fil_rev_8_21_14_0_10_37_12]
MYENIDLRATVRGEQSGLEAKALDRLSPELRKKTGIGFDGVKVQKDRYEVTVHPLVDGRPTGNATGASDSSYDDALRDASNDGGLDYNQNDIELTHSRTVVAPYFMRTIAARGLTENDCLEALALSEGELQRTYGTRMQEKPQDTRYDVANMNKRYELGNLPPITDELPEGRIVSKGHSTESFDDAIGNIGRVRRYKTRVFEASFTYKVFGEDDGLLVETEGQEGEPTQARSSMEGTPVIVTPRKAGKSGSALAFAGSAVYRGGGGADATSAYIAETDLC